VKLSSPAAIGGGLLISLLLLPPVAFAATSSGVRYVMGTLLQVRVEASDAEGAKDAAFAEVERQDRLLSTYKEASEISRVNAAAGRAALPVSSDTYRVVDAALDYARKSSGAFDPTAQRDAALVGYQDVTLDRKESTIRLKRAGMRLDLGGIGKGYALDRALEAAKPYGVESLWMDFGGQLLIWRRHPAPSPIVIEAADAKDRGAKALLAGNGSVASSSNAERPGHLLDPRTGRPSTGTLRVTVIAPTATAADAWSTALFVLGPDRGEALLQSYPEIQALWAWRDAVGPLHETSTRAWRAK
jgi:FAD:protein FMN transferase